MVFDIPQDFIGNSLSYLIQILKKSGRTDIQTVEALLIRMTGNVNAGRMAYRLLYWFPKSVKKTGEVYKSWRDWEAELCISRNQVGTVHAGGYLEAIGFTRRQRQTAKGNPVHYKLNVSAFFTAVARFLNVTFDILLAWISGKGESENQETACDNSQQDNNTHTPKTEDNSYNNNHNNDTVLFSIPGMKTKFLLQLIKQYGLERVKEVYQAAKETEGVRNIPSWVVKALKEEWVVAATDENPFEGYSWSDFARRD